MAEALADDVKQHCQPCSKKSDNRAADIFCKTCGEFQCLDCSRGHEIYSYMGGHELVSIRDTLKNTLVDTIYSTNQVTELLDEAKSRLSDDYLSLFEKLKGMKTSFIPIFTEFVDELIAYANKEIKSTQDRLALKNDECKTLIKSMKETVCTLDSKMSTGTPAEQLNRMPDEVQSVVKAATSIHEELSRIKIQFSFDDQVKKFISTLQSKFNSLNISYHLPSPSKFEFVKSIELKVDSDNSKEPLYTGLSFLPDNRLVVIDNENNKCLIYDVNLSEKKSCELPYKNPQCAAVVSDDTIVVTSGAEYRLDFVNVGKRSKFALDKKNNCEMEAEYYSISVMNNREFVVSTIDHIKPFRIVSMSGKETDFNIKTPSKKYSLDRNYCTFICGRNIVVQTDTDEDKIYIYNIESEENIIVKNELVKSPCDVAVGPYDHVFVVSKGTKCLVEITPGGRVLSSHRVDMKYPRSIAISKDKKLLAVSNAATGARKLSLYKIA